VGTKRRRRGKLGSLMTEDKVPLYCTVLYGMAIPQGVHFHCKFWIPQM